MSTEPAVVSQRESGPSATDGERILELSGVHTYYGNIHALKGVTMHVGLGEIVTLIGSNGAGKSTTLRTISGIERAREGTIRLKGRDITNLPRTRLSALASPTPPRAGASSVA